MIEKLHEVTIYLDIQADTRDSGEEPIYTFMAQIMPTRELDIANLIEELRVAFYRYVRTWARGGATLIFWEGPECE